MKKILTLLLASFLSLVGDPHVSRAFEDSGPGGARAKPTGDPSTKKSGEKSKMTESSFTWGYFFAPTDKGSVQAAAQGHKQSITVYHVDKIVAIKGPAAIDLPVGTTLVRLETPARLSAKTPGLLFHGLPQHLQYTTGEQRTELLKISRAELPAGKDTLAVIIPIRKNATWWALPLDERMAHFHKKGDKIGHTAIGAKYAGQIYRKLYHARYAVEAKDHDFITYFEFERSKTADFQSLLRSLRDPEQNPEWTFVDREYEIWMTKKE